MYMYITYVYIYIMQCNQQAFCVSIYTYNTYVYICIFLMCTYTSCNSINGHSMQSKTEFLMFDVCFVSVCKKI